MGTADSATVRGAAVDDRSSELRPRTRRTLMAAAGATFASLFAAGRTEAAPGQPVLQGRDNQAGTARTSLISAAGTSTLRVVNNISTPRDNCAAIVANGEQNYAVLAQGKNKSGIWARHLGATTNPDQPAALRPTATRTQGSSPPRRRHAVQHWWHANSPPRRPTAPPHQG